MTIRELAEKNQQIMDIEVTLRTEKSLFIHRYRFGGGAKYYPGDEAQAKSLGKRMENIVTIDNTEINAYDIRSGKDYYQLKLDKIPKKYQFILDKEVGSWTLSSSYRTNSTHWNGSKLLYVTCYEGESVKNNNDVIKTKVDDVNEKVDTKKALTGWENLPGQMTLTDWEEGLCTKDSTEN